MSPLQSITTVQYCYEYVINQISVDLLLYAHIPTALTAVLFGLYLLYKKRTVASSSLFAVCLGFALWCFLNLITWFVFIGDRETMFAWSLIDLVGLVFFFFSYRFLYAFIYDTDLPTWKILLGIAVIAPTHVTTFLGMNLVGFDANVCEAVEDDQVVLYTYLAQVFFMLAILALGVHAYRTIVDRVKRSQAIVATVGVLLFLLFFFFANFLVLLLINYTAVEYAYNFGIYGLFGMPILLMYLGYLIVRYKAFDIKLAGAQALIVTLLGLVASKLFFISSTPDLVISVVTVLLVLIFGYFLVRSVKQEIREKERNAELAKDLAKANVRLRQLDKLKSEFVSIASHQLRSPLTAMRGYASMLLEGSFGSIPEKAKEPLSRIEESSRFMALSVDDFLNVSRIESGSMKYEMSVFSLKELASTIADEMRPAAMKKGLVLLFRSDATTDMHVKADVGKLRQILQNLVDNAMKYTPKGSIDIVAHDDVKAKKAFVSIIDTGVGMSEETLATIFDKFVRAKNANTVNVYGTGLGLYIAKQMAEAMGATITTLSKGEGQGSTFRIELPLQK